MATRYQIFSLLILLFPDTFSSFNPLTMLGMFLKKDVLQYTATPDAIIGRSEIVVMVNIMPSKNKYMYLQSYRTSAWTSADNPQHIPSPAAPL
jgi:hypothetical protein